MAKIDLTFNLRSFIFKSVVIFIALTGPKAFAEPLLNGVATHIELGKEQFIAGLYASTLSDSSNNILIAQEDKRLQVRILAAQLSTRRFRRMWIEGMAINATSTELKKYSKDMAAFSNLLKIKMVAGDIFTVDRNSAGTTISVNGTQLGVIEDPAFFDLLLRTWIGPVPLSSDFRSSLLTAGQIKPGPLSRFENTKPSDARINLIAKAVSAKKEDKPAITKPTVDTSIAAPTIPAPVTPSTTQAAEPDKKVTIAAPTINAQPEATPTPEPATPTPEPVAVALAPAEEELDESIFDDEEDEEFTAESLLKEQLYYSQLAKYTHRYLKYPQKAWDRGREGNIRLRVTIDRSGKVKNTDILEPAKYKALNKEAKKAVGRASPYPAMPEDLSGDEYSFTFRIAFKIVDRR